MTNMNQGWRVGVRAGAGVLAAGDGWSRSDCLPAGGCGVWWLAHHDRVSRNGRRLAGSSWRRNELRTSGHWEALRCRLSLRVDSVDSVDSVEREKLHG